MRAIVTHSIVAMAAMAFSGEPQANFLHVVVTATHPVTIHAIWRPFAGAVGADGENQQAALRTRGPEGLRRSLDLSVRDTIVVRTPADFVIDMTGGPASIEALGADSIRVQAQLLPARGAIVARWGRQLVVTADGVQPSVELSKRAPRRPDSQN